MNAKTAPLFLATGLAVCYAASGSSKEAECKEAVSTACTGCADDRGLAYGNITLEEIARQLELSANQAVQ